MDPESEEGNVEYKLCLLKKEDQRVENLATQMRYRCDEGYGECIYNIGVTDDGEMVGITDAEYEETMVNMKKMSDMNNYTITLLSSTPADDDKKVYEVLVREHNEKSYIDLKVAVIGGVDAGKSSTLSVLTIGKEDNGRGSARAAIFNFEHELKSGRTSSIAHHILGYDRNGDIVNYKDYGKKSWPEIVASSSKIVSLLDMAGHEKYLKTTILGLASSVPDMAMLIVAGNKGIQKMTKEHIFLCLALKIPFFIVVTKIDMCEKRGNVLQETNDQINSILKSTGVRKIPLRVKSEEDLILSAKNIYSDSVVPVFYISNTSKLGYEYLTKFFNISGKRFSVTADSKSVEYHIDSFFNVRGVGQVLGGHLISGTVRVGDKLLVGPINNKYEQIQIKGIHCKRVPLTEVTSGCYVCFAFKKAEKSGIRKGNVIISQDRESICCHEFRANILVLKSHSTTIRVGYEPVVHACALRQSASLQEIISKENARTGMKDDDVSVLRTGDRAVTRFKFKHRGEYLKTGSRILLCEGRTKVVGTVL